MRILFTLIALLSANANAAVCSRTMTFVDGAVLTASQLNAEFNAITNCANSLDNANISVSANILPIKLDPSIVFSGGGLYRDVSGGLQVNPDDSSIIVSGGEVKVGPLGIDVSMLANDAVTTIKILDANVTTPKIADLNVTKGKLETSVQQSLVPTGTVLPFAGSLPPAGYLMCDGTTVDNITYPDLFAVIGTFYGTGGLPADFKLPDYRGRFLRGTDNGTGRDPDAASRTAMNTGGNIGDSVGSIQSSQYGSHSHTVSPSSSISYQSIFGGGGSPGLTLSGAPTQVTFSSGSSGGNETRPINASINYIIKY